MNIRILRGRFSGRTMLIVSTKEELKFLQNTIFMEISKRKFTMNGRIVLERKQFVMVQTLASKKCDGNHKNLLY